MDNPDYLVFSDIDINQRNLWWKSISGGYLSENSKISTGIGVVWIIVSLIGIFFYHTITEFSVKVG
jgi:hypothetical protein